MHCFHREMCRRKIVCLNVYSTFLKIIYHKSYDGRCLTKQTTVNLLEIEKSRHVMLNWIGQVASGMYGMAWVWVYMCVWRENNILRIAANIKFHVYTSRSNTFLIHLVFHVYLNLKFTVIVVMLKLMFKSFSSENASLVHFHHVRCGWLTRPTFLWQ